MVLSLANTARPTSSPQPVQFSKLNKLGDSDYTDAWFSMVERCLTGHEVGQGRFAMTDACNRLIHVDVVLMLAVWRICLRF